MNGLLTPTSNTFTELMIWCLKTPSGFMKMVQLNLRFFLKLNTMGNISKIQWTDATWNVARGCTKVDQDCKYCYMYRQSKLYGYDAMDVVRTKTVFNMPLKLKEPSLIFTSSLTDFFHPSIDSYRHEAWDIIRKCPQHTFQILTKRPERILENLPADWGTGWDNVWIGTSVGSPKGMQRIFDLLEIPTKVRFISFEPLHERISLDHIDLSKIDWAIIGGESGNNTGKYRYRPCQLEWIEKLINDLSPTTQVFVKQLGTYLSKELKLKDRHGGDISEFPEHLQIREMPVQRKKGLDPTEVGVVYLASDFNDRDWKAHTDLCFAGIPLHYHPDDENGEIWEGLFFSKVALALMDLVAGGVVHNTPNKDAIRLFKKHYPKEFQHYVKHRGSPELEIVLGVRLESKNTNDGN